MSQQPQHPQNPQNPYGAPYGGPQHAQPQPPKQRSWFARHKVLTGIGAIAAVVVIATAVNGGGDDGGDKEDQASSSVKDGDTKKDGDAKGEKKEKKESGLGGSGTYEVGSDIKPGTYRSTGNSDGMCYWERAKDSTGEMESIIANDNVTGTAYVTVKESDKIFKSTECKSWETVDEKAKGSPAGGDVKGDGGMFKVGVDIAPGTYKSSDNTDDMCYWERTKDAESRIESIVANDNVTGSAIVTISPQDAYFKTTGCSDWKKTG
ncbi:hypothetical protein [Streptomyces apocyni]|uniref:hypothetical protein n=1 Tax=Streptomyces apocyni TaxID=2654677 RepID=UPI001E4772A9|nr:hypothetical protein [Streptomyces apocyni]